MVILAEMRRNINRTLTSLLGLVCLTAALALSFFIFGKDYALNVAVRRVALRLAQVEVLSRTTETDFRAVFEADRCRVEIFDKEAGGWKSFLESGYGRGISVLPPAADFIFSGGAFKEFIWKDKRDTLTRYLRVEFMSAGNRKKSLVFYREGNWKVFGRALS